MAGLVSIAIIEDHTLARMGLQEVCSSNPDWRVNFSGDSVQTFLESEDSFDLLILDLGLYGELVTDEAVSQFIDQGLKVLVVSALSTPSRVRSLLRAGVLGFVSKHESEEVLIDAIKTVSDGEKWTSAELAAIIASDLTQPILSDQEKRALGLYASGLKMQSVARIMGVKESTAKEYIDRIRSKYIAIGRPAPTKVHLARNAEQDGYI